MAFDYLLCIANLGFFNQPANQLLPSKRNSVNETEFKKKHQRGNSLKGNHSDLSIPPVFLEVQAKKHEKQKSGSSELK